jgi:hypothetical protein
MAKEWILNQANMRWGLTRKSKVGPVADMIRKCSPKDLHEWEDYYHRNGYSKEHLDQLGRILYVKVSEICKAEIQTIYGQLESVLGVKVEPATDEWDRGYNGHFFIKVKNRFIGLQIKPAGYAYIPQIINEAQFQKRTHDKFTEKFGGKVFYIISVAENKRKVIYNPEVIEKIREEIARLGG